MHWFLNPPPSGSDETRPQFVVNLFLLTAVAFPVAVAGVLSLIRDRELRPLGWTVVGTVVAYFVLGGKSYYALPVVVFALAAGAIPLDRWATHRRLLVAGGSFVVVDLLVLPITLPVLPLHTAVRLGVVKARGDYQSEIGWPAYVRLVERQAAGADVIVAANYGEAGALRLFGRGLPPVASADVTMRYWRPHVTGRQALVIGYSRRAADFCTGYRLVARISTAGRQRRARPADRAVHAPRHARAGLAEHRRDAELAARASAAPTSTVGRWEGATGPAGRSRRPGATSAAAVAPRQEVRAVRVHAGGKLGVEDQVTVTIECREERQ